MPRVDSARARSFRGLSAVKSGDVLTYRLRRTDGGFYEAKFWIVHDNGELYTETHTFMNPIEMGYAMKQYPIVHPLEVRLKALRWKTRRAQGATRWLG